MEEKNERQEIDLMEFIILALKILKKRKFIVLFVFVFGATLGVYKSYKQKDIIEFSSICESRLINSDIIVRIADKFHETEGKHNFNDSTKLENEFIKNIISTKVDTLKRPNVILTIKGSNLDDINRMKLNLFSFFNNQFKTKIELEIKEKETILALLLNNLAKFDSLQKYVATTKGTSNFNLPSSLNNDNIPLYEKKIKLEGEIYLLKKDGILSEITNSMITIPHRSMLSSGILFSLLSTFLCIMILFSIEFIVYLNKQVQ